MRLVPCVVAVSLALVGSARADSYPQMVVDRPLMLLPDMTEADVGVVFPTYAVGLSTHTKLGQYYNVDVGVSHAFGPVELGVQFVDDISGPLISAGPRFMLGPGAVDLDLTVRMPTSDSGIDHQDVQDIRYTYKWIPVPSGLAFYANAGFSLEEYANAYSMTDWHMFADAGGGAELQVAPELAMSAGARVTSQLDAPINDRMSYAAGGQVTYVYDRFDVYANLWFYDLAHTRTPYAGIGVVARFGG
jgi:hypothetical protein